MNKKTRVLKLFLFGPQFFSVPAFFFFLFTNHWRETINPFHLPPQLLPPLIYQLRTTRHDFPTPPPRPFCVFTPPFPLSPFTTTLIWYLSGSVPSRSSIWNVVRHLLIPVRGSINFLAPHPKTSLFLQHLVHFGFSKVWSFQLPPETGLATAAMLLFGPAAFWTSLTLIFARDVCS